MDVNTKLVQLSKDTDIPLVVTRDVHYLNTGDAEAQDILRCIGNGWKVDQPDRSDYRQVDMSLNFAEDISSRFRHVAEAIENTGTIELAFLERGLVVLATLSNVAPMFGFLGTVTGMIRAFAQIEKLGEVSPQAVAGGIKEALITTAAGLAIAIPIQIFHNYFVTRVDRLILDMEESSQNIIEAVISIEDQTPDAAPDATTKK